MKKQFALPLILTVALFATACSTAWVSTLDSILAAAAPALVDILQIVAVASNQPLNSNLVTKINSDAGDIKTLAQDFATASTTAGPGVCKQLQAAIGAYQADQNTVLQLAQVSDSKTQTKITLLATLVAGTVGAITEAIPSCQQINVTAPPPAAFRGAPPLTLSKFTDSYNAVLTTKTGNVAVDALTPQLVIHKHSKFVRKVTFGLAK